MIATEFVFVSDECDGEDSGEEEPSQFTQIASIDLRKKREA